MTASGARHHKQSHSVTSKSVPHSACFFRSHVVTRSHMPASVQPMAAPQQWMDTESSGVQRSGEIWRCSLCDMQGSGRQWRRHAEGLRHKQRATQQRATQRASRHDAAAASATSATANASSPASTTQALAPAAVAVPTTPAALPQPLEQQQPKPLDGTAPLTQLPMICALISLCTHHRPAVQLQASNGPAVRVPHHQSGAAAIR